MFSPVAANFDHGGPVDIGVDHDTTPKAKVLRTTRRSKEIAPPIFQRRSTRISNRTSSLQEQYAKKAPNQRDLTPPGDIFGPDPTRQQLASTVSQSMPQSPQSFGLAAFLQVLKPPAIPIQIPSSISSRISTATKGLTKSDLNLNSSSHELRKVVPFSPMLDQLLPDIQDFLAGPEFDDGAWWLNKVKPDLTSSHLPRQIFTEHDTEDYIWAVIIRPAIAVIHHCLYGDEHHDFPGASSIGGSSPVPDGILFGKNIQDLVAVFEFKNPVVLDKSEETLDELLQTWPKMKLGRAAKFNWPQRINGLTKTTKLLCQVWRQMDAKKVFYGVLSSYKRTYFLVRSAEDPSALYISRSYSYDEDILFITTVFIALAVGCLRTKQLLLPKVDIAHWTGLGHSEKHDPTTPGLVELTMAPKVPGENDTVTDREEKFKWVDKESDD
ncbi:hypothetical protein PLEOSDRAFT_1114584 [Pleurotus ostreatus PC15]|uniref:Uncharacterized protein n=1 Tax=Pleurotus ostreatus (strain PC15) TaxID=1137138 RepID=A0A067N647_PLEO1|nr:hypothetical protein PLEOSDRAFT_1114584 [Pleurotus ostreatus PC15]